MTGWLIFAACVYVLIAVIWFGVSADHYAYYRTHYHSEERVRWAKRVLMAPVWPVAALGMLSEFLGEVSEAADPDKEEQR